MVDEGGRRTYWPSTAGQFEREQHRLRSSRQGFTLAEILVVIAIVAIVTAIAWMAIGGRVKAAAKRAGLASDLRQIAMAISIYRGDNDDGFPSNWRGIGYCGINKKDKFSPGFPPRDVYYDKPPVYDVSYHTPECAAPPVASPAISALRQSIELFNSKPRANLLDVDSTQAVSFFSACLANSRGKHAFSFMENGKIRTVYIQDLKSMGVNFAGSLSYEWSPDWLSEIGIRP